MKGSQNRMSKNSKQQKGEQQRESEINTVNTNDFNIKNFSVETIKYSKDATQFSGYCRYDFGKKKNMGPNEKAENGNTKDRCVIVTKPIEIKRGGIPSHSDKWRPTDNSRLYFWLNLDQDEGGKDLYDKVLKPLDELFSKEINKNGNKNFIYQITASGETKPLTKLSFKECVKMSPSGDDEDSGAHKSVLPPYQRIKVKLATVFDENLNQDEPQKIKTKVFVDGIEGEIKINCLNDLIEQFPWGCTAEFALEVNKFWAMKSGDPRNCGYGLKCLAIHVTSKPKQTSQTQVNASIFGSSFKSSKEEKVTDTKSDAGAGSDSDSDSDSDKEKENDDSDKEDVVDSGSKKDKKDSKNTKNVKESKESKESKNTKDSKPSKPSNDSDSESDKDSDKESEKSEESEDEAEAPAPALATPPTKNTKNTSSSTGTKGKGSKKTAKSDSESDADSDAESAKDSDDEAAKPSKKVVAKKEKEQPKKKK